MALRPPAPWLSPTRQRGESWRLRLRGGIIGGKAPPLSVPSGQLLHLAVPGKHIGLTLILVFSDRCGKSTIASSAPGSAMALFPLRGERQVRAAIPPTRGEPRARCSYNSRLRNPHPETRLAQGGGLGDAPPILSFRLAERKERAAPGGRKKRALVVYSLLSIAVRAWSLML